MAIKKTLTQRILNVSRISIQSFTNCRISNPAVFTRHPPDPSSAADPGENGGFRRFLHRESMVKPRDRRAMDLPAGEALVERLRAMDVARRDRSRLDGLAPPPLEKSPAAEKGLTVEDARKVMRVAQLAGVKARLRGLEKSSISLPELVRICGEADPDRGVAIAKALDESGSVIVLGNVVFLRPDQDIDKQTIVVKAMEDLLQFPKPSPNELKMRELEEMERVKFTIDRKAESLVKQELWCGLGFLVLQTAGFMRLTFWELSWDVMEPICFYVTSLYFMTGYAFFLRTSREPSFEGFFQSRFLAKQKRLMERRGFDMDRYNQLRRACGLKPVAGPVFDVSEIAKLQH